MMYVINEREDYLRRRKKHDVVKRKKKSGWRANVSGEIKGERWKGVIDLKRISEIVWNTRHGSQHEAYISIRQVFNSSHHDESGITAMYADND